MLTGRRNTIPAQVIAEKSQVLVDFPDMLAAGYPTLQKAVYEETEKWRGPEGMIPAMKSASQAQPDAMFGQSAPSDARG